MAQAGSYKFTISALDDASGVIEKVNKKLAQLQAPVNRFNRAITTFGDRSGISKVIEELGNLGKMVINVTSGVAKLVAGVLGIGSIASAAGIVDLIRHFATLGAQITSNSQILGMSTEKLAKWMTMARLAGASNEDVISTFKNLEQLQRNIFIDPQNHQAEVRLNESRFHIKQGDSPEVMYQKIASVLNTLSPAAQQAVRSLTGVSENLQRLEKPGAIEKYGETADKFAPSAKDIENGDKLNSSVLELKESVTKLMNDVISLFAPDLTKMTGSLEHFITVLGDTLKPNLTKWANDFSQWLDNIKPEDINKMVQQVVDSIKGLPDMISKIKTALEVIAGIWVASKVAQVATTALAFGRLGAGILGAVGGGSTVASLLPLLATGQAGGEATPEENLKRNNEFLLRDQAKDDLLTRFSKWLFGTDTNVLSHWLLGSTGMGISAALEAAQRSAAGVKGAAGSSPIDPTTTGGTQPSAPTIPPATAAAISGVGNNYGSRADAILKAHGVDTAALEKQYGLPSGILSGIKMHESGLEADPHAARLSNPKSTARGFFQILKDTATGLGVADRFDPQQSAAGAAKYLAQLTKDFHGDSRKALAAYGAGPETIRRIVAAYGDAWEQHLPSESGDLLRKVGGSMGGVQSAGGGTPTQASGGHLQIDINHNNVPQGVTMDTTQSGIGFTVNPGQTMQPMPTNAPS